MNTREHLIWPLCSLNPTVTFPFFTTGISYLSWSLSQGPSQTVFTQLSQFMYATKLSDKQSAPYQMKHKTYRTIPPKSCLLQLLFCWRQLTYLCTETTAHFVDQYCSVSLHLHFSDSSKHFFPLLVSTEELLDRLFTSIVVVASRTKYSIYNQWMKKKSPGKKTKRQNNLSILLKNPFISLPTLKQQ